jgi:hypothetical protein
MDRIGRHLWPPVAEPEEPRVEPRLRYRPRGIDSLLSAQVTNEQEPVLAQVDIPVGPALKAGLLEPRAPGVTSIPMTTPGLWAGVKLGASSLRPGHGKRERTDLATRVHAARVSKSTHRT